MAGVKLSQIRLRSRFFKKKKYSNNNNGQGSIQKIDTAPSSAEFAAQNSSELGSSGAGSDEPAKTLQKKFAKLGITNVGGAGGDADGDAGNDSDDGGGDQNKKEGGSSGNGEKAVKTVNDGVNLLGEGKFQKVSYRLPPRRTNSININGYLDSRRSLSEDIMKALSDPDADLIGVCGVRGVGKTTLVREVTQQAKENKLFDVVVWVVVTETPDIMQIQGQIADALGMKLQQESEPGRAAQLRERMKKENRILVILDDVWAKLDLESIGIPVEDDEKGSITQKVDQEGENAHKRQCKILLTSRRLDILRDDMDIQKNFKVEPLCFEEAQSLFWKHVGDTPVNCDFHPVGLKIVNECHGFPVAINTIANALMHRSLPVWKDALNNLKRYNPKDIKKLNDGNDGDDGDDDDNNSGGGDKNKKKGGGSGDGEGNGDGGDKAEGGGGRKEKGMNEDCTGQLGFSYRCTYHAGYENEYPVEQLNAVKMFCSENMINDCSIMPSLNLVHC